VDFEYRVRDKQGHLRKGILQSDNYKTAITSLLSQGYYVLRVKETRRYARNIRFDISLKSIKSHDLVILTRQLATMIAAGLPLISCLTVLQKQTANRRLREVIAKIQSDIESGHTFWEAVARHANVFSPIYIQMIKAGELGGVLDKILANLSRYLEREQELNAKLRAALIYPAVISLFAILVVFFMIILVMPTFVDMFRFHRLDLPAPTRILLSTGSTLRQAWIYIIPFAFALIMAGKRWGQTASGRLFYDYLYLHLPLLGRPLSRISVARLARTIGTLIKAGIPVLQALETAGEAVGNVIIARAVNKARLAVREGKSITVELEKTALFEPMVTQMIAVGEETGSLDEMFLHISDYYEQAAIHMIDSIMALLEPLLVFLVALIVGGVVLATLLPIFELINAVGV
jgi:type IV pilus assembly protein PilC